VVAHRVLGDVTVADAEPHEAGRFDIDFEKGLWTSVDESRHHKIAGHPLYRYHRCDR
jgi:hypothetical protein